MALTMSIEIVPVKKRKFVALDGIEVRGSRAALATCREVLAVDGVAKVRAVTRSGRVHLLVFYDKRRKVAVAPVERFQERW
jgi:hypothetical protein